MSWVLSYFSVFDRSAMIALRRSTGQAHLVNDRIIDSVFHRGEVGRIRKAFMQSVSQLLEKEGTIYKKRELFTRTDRSRSANESNRLENGAIGVFRMMWIDALQVQHAQVRLRCRVYTCRLLEHMFLFTFADHSSATLCRRVSSPESLSSG